MPNLRTPASGLEGKVLTGLWCAISTYAHLDPFFPLTRPCRAFVRIAGSGEPDVPVAGFPEEVLLERKFHRVRLRPGDEHPVLARRQHLVGQDDHSVVPGVHDADRRD